MFAGQDKASVSFVEVLDVNTTRVKLEIVIFCVKGYLVSPSLKDIKAACVCH